MTITNKLVIFNHLRKVNGEVAKIDFEDGVIKKTLLESLFLKGKKAANNLKELFK